MIILCKKCEKFVHSLAKGGKMCKDCLIRKVAETLLEKIRSDLDDRRGFHLDWEDYEEFMKEDWIKIVTRELKEL